MFAQQKRPFAFVMDSPVLWLKERILLNCTVALLKINIDIVQKQKIEFYFYNNLG